MHGSTPDSTPGAMAGQLRELVNAVQATNRQLTELRRQRAAERARITKTSPISVNGFEPDPDCCVCYEPLDRPHAVITACGHVYHRACIENAIESATLRRCPICRRAVDPAELVQIMNGLPSRVECPLDTSDSDNEQVIDLTRQIPSPPNLHRSANQKVPSSDCNSDNGLSTCTDESALADNLTSLDREIQRLLDQCCRLLEKSVHVEQLEEAMEEELEMARAQALEAQAAAEVEREMLLEQINEKQSELRAREARLRVSEEALSENRIILKEKIAEARQEASKLVTSIKAAEEARQEAVESKELAEQAKMQCDERRLRYQRLVSQFEKKTQNLKTEQNQIQGLVKENQTLNSLVQALRNQLRTVRLPNSEFWNKTASTSDSGRHKTMHEPSRDYNPRRLPPEPNPLSTEPVLDEKNENEDDDNDSDVVAAAEEIYQRSRPTNSNTASVNRNEHVGGHLQDFADISGAPRGPHAAFKSDHLPPRFGVLPAQRITSARRIDGRHGPGLSVFAPKAAEVVARPGAVAAMKGTSAQPIRVLGVKRALAPPVAGPPASKMKSTRLDAFIKSRISDSE